MASGIRPRPAGMGRPARRPGTGPPREPSAEGGRRHEPTRVTDGPRQGAAAPDRGPRPPNRSRRSETRSSEHIKDTWLLPRGPVTRPPTREKADMTIQADTPARGRAGTGAGHQIEARDLV